MPGQTLLVAQLVSGQQLSMHYIKSWPNNRQPTTPPTKSDKNHLLWMSCFVICCSAPASPLLRACVCCCRRRKLAYSSYLQRFQCTFILPTCSRRKPRSSVGKSKRKPGLTISKNNNIYGRTLLSRIVGELEFITFSKKSWTFKIYCYNNILY